MVTVIPDFTLFVQMAIFLALIFILNNLLFKPILSIIDRRKKQLNELEKLNVPVLMETEVTPELVKNENPDVIFAATGAEPIIPNISGIDRPNRPSSFMSSTMSEGTSSCSSTLFSEGTRRSRMKRCTLSLSREKVSVSSAM